MLGACKKNYEEKEKKEKAENTAKFAALELTITEMMETQKKVEKKREEDCLKNAKKIEILPKEVKKEKEKNKEDKQNIVSEMLEDSRANEEQINRMTVEEKEQNYLKLKCLEDWSKTDCDPN